MRHGIVVDVSAADRTRLEAVVAGMGSLYGDQITAFFSRYYKPALLILIGLAVLGGILTYLQYLRARRKQHHHQEVASSSRAA